MTADGAVVTELKEETIREIAGQARSKGIRSVAVCLLHAYKYPKHEQRIARAAAGGRPRHLRVAVLGGLPGGARVRPRLDDGRQRLYPPADGRPCRPSAARIRHARVSTGRCLWMTSSRRPRSEPPRRRIAGASDRIRPGGRRGRGRRVRPNRRARQACCPLTWAAPRPSSA